MNSRQENRSKLSFTTRIIPKYSLEHFLSICGGTLKIAGGVGTGIAMHCGYKIFKMAAKVEKFPRLYEGPEGVKWDWNWPKIWVGK